MDRIGQDRIDQAVFNFSHYDLFHPLIYLALYIHGSTLSIRCMPSLLQSSQPIEHYTNRVAVGK